MLDAFGAPCLSSIVDMATSHAMHIIPHTSQEWERFLLFPFKAYVLVAFVMATLFHRGLRVDGTVLWVLLGYIVSFLVLLSASILQAATGGRSEAISSIVFAGLAVLFGWQLLEYLASV
jgi:hypothetical protein